MARPTAEEVDAALMGKHYSWSADGNSTRWKTYCGRLVDRELCLRGGSVEFVISVGEVCQECRTAFNQLRKKQDHQHT